MAFLSFKKNLRFDNKKERYETRLPFKDYSETLPDNYNLAKHRLSSLKNRLSKNEYDKFRFHSLFTSQSSRKRK